MPTSPPNMRFEHGSPKPDKEKKRSKPSAPSGHRPWQVNVLIAAGIIVLTLGITFFYVGERERETKNMPAAPKIDKVGALREMSKTKEEAFEEIKLTKAEITETDLELFDEAVRALEQYLEAQPDDLEQTRRIDNLRTRQHVVHAERLRSISKAAEAKAQQDESAEQGIAQRELGKALEAEKEIDEKWYFSGMVNKGKIAQLGTRIRRIEAEPIWKKTRSLEVQAEAFFNSRKLVEAEDCFKEAIALEQEFTEKYRDVLNTEFNRINKLNGRLETVRSFLLQQALTKLEEEANAAELRGEWLKATALWDEAIKQIAKIINQFAQSEFASRSHEAELVKRRNLARAHPDTETIKKEISDMRQMLQKAQTEPALIKARSLLVQMTKVEVSNPGAFPEANPLVQEVDYITKHEGTIRVLLSSLDRLLLPIPGENSKRMFKQEVAQSLYSLVTGKNPSALVRGTAPVESVSYDDAVAFNRQLSWVLGRTVRLPRLDEIKKVAGDLTAAPTRSSAWTFDSTDGLTVMDVATSQPTATGYYDIIGNVEEWVEAEPNTSIATVVGGNVNWVPQPGLPQRQIQKKERSRTLGFRFVVE